MGECAPLLVGAREQKGVDGGGPILEIVKRTFTGKIVLRRGFEEGIFRRHVAFLFVSDRDGLDAAWL